MTNTDYHKIVLELLKSDPENIDVWFCVTSANKPDGIFYTVQEMKNYVNKYGIPSLDLKI